MVFEFQIKRDRIVACRLQSYQRDEARLDAPESLGCFFLRHADSAQRKSGEKRRY
jgi:hypothetical protein